MTIDEMIAVLQASKEGKKIEAKSRVSYDSKWGTPPLNWDFHNFDYRVKHEPMEIEVWVLDNGNPMEIVRKHHEPSHYREWTKKKFREVIE